jgi:hypothetical protein
MRKCLTLLLSLCHHPPDQGVSLWVSIHDPKTPSQRRLPTLEEELSHQLIHKGWRRHLDTVEIEANDLTLIQEGFCLAADLLPQQARAQDLAPIP